MDDEDDFHKQNTLPDLSGKESRSPSQPQKIGPYKIESLLNKGGMSLLYLGIHPTTHQPLAIKVLLPKYGKNKEMVGRFLKEAQIIALTNHPNIVKLYGQGQWEKGLYIAMEFIQGVSLRQFIQHKSLSQRRAFEIILQVAYALCHLHTHGVIHRDLKPENILITESGEIKVIDFGIAQLQDDGREERITQNRRLMGTPIYMSPEQKENPLQVSYSSDIYSLGIIAYELILGRLSHGVIHLALLPKNLRKIIEKALQTDPANRYHDIVDFITDVSQYVKSLESEAPLRNEEIPDEMLQMVDQARSLLVQTKAPRWPQIEMGISVREGSSFSGLYLDFFRLQENRYAIFIAEPLVMETASTIYSSVLRGMIRMSMGQFFQNGKKDQHPIQMLHGLNRILAEDPMGKAFSLSLLLLNPDKDQLAFVSCQAGPLLHIPGGSQKPRVLTTPNPALGAEAGASLLETADNWNAGDVLWLSSTQIRLPKGDEPLDKGLLALSPQSQAEQLMERATGGKPSAARSSTLLTIHRIF